MTSDLLTRAEFRDRALDRDDGQCLVPWCDAAADEVHHIIERSLWDDGGYYLRNGASVCNPHHQYAEQNHIPPHAFWRWIGDNGVEPLTPDGLPVNITKWGPDGACDGRGETFETPPWQDHRDFHKYPSTRHLLPVYWHDTLGDAASRTGRDDTGLTTVEPFLDVPLVVTIKLDGGNTMMVKDPETPIRARNGRDATHESFDRLKDIYWEKNVYETLPDHLQIFGENMVGCHSIHYGCDGCHDERNQAPPLDAYFYVFGVFDTRYNVWLSWAEVEQWADRIGFPTAPVVTQTTYDHESEFCTDLATLGADLVTEGHEGFIVRSRFPFHYSQFSHRLGKYVRPNHVQTDEHWSQKPLVQNHVADEP